MKEQEKISLDKMIALNEEDSKEIDECKYLFIFDDILSDQQFKRFDSKLSMFSTLCWHFSIHQIILTQMWTRIPKTIRMQSNLSILLSTDNYTKELILENCWFEEYKFLLDLYQKINGLKTYAALIINKVKKNDKWYLVVLSQDNKYCYIVNPMFN